MQLIRKITVFMSLVGLSLLVNNCAKDDPISLCTITKPENKTVFSIGDIVEIKVDVNNNQANQRYSVPAFIEVRLFINNIGVASESEFPYVFHLNTSGYTPGIYEIKAVAIYTQGVQASDQIEIELKSGVPKVETLNATDIKSITAIVAGIINCRGGADIIESGMYWDTIPDSQNGNKVIVAPVKGRMLTTLKGLPPGKLIYYRAFASNVHGEGLGDEKSFITIGDGMTPTCKIITPDENTTVGRGEIVNIWVEAIDPDGNNLEVRLFVNEIGITSTNHFPYTFAWTTEQFNPGNHKIKVVAIDNQGFSCSDTRNIIIGVRKPIVETTDAINIGLTSARVGGKILASGGTPVTQAGVYWGLNPEPQLSGNKISGEINNNNFSLGLSGLSTNTVYYYQAYAVNNMGESTGEVKAFKTTGNQLGTFVDPRDNREYQWVIIGRQKWMAENLAYLPEVSPPGIGSNEKRHYYVYGYSGTSVDEARDSEYYHKYGVLYNWQAAVQACPVGWRVPDDEDWKELEKALGMSVLEAGNAGWRGTYEGRYMKAKHGWYNNGNGSNISDFNAIPGGFRLSLRFFDFEGKYANWWTSSDFSATHSWFRSLYFDNSGVFRNNARRDQGFSVRCVKD